MINRHTEEIPFMVRMITALFIALLAVNFISQVAKYFGVL